MNWIPQGLGAEPKKLAVLGGLIVLGAIGYYFSHDSGPDQAASASVTAKKSAAEEPADVPAIPVRAQTPQPSAAKRSTGGPRGGRAVRGGGNVDAFHPSLKPQDGLDLSTIDPTIHLGLLAKLRDLPMQGGGRSVFKEGAAPPVDLPKVTVKPGAVAEANKSVTMPVEPPKPPGPPPPPPPTPIPLKFYGYVNQSHKRAFFLEGEDIFVAGENDVVKNRYKIIKIGVNSAIVEDTTDKHQQTLPLIEEFTG